jgi:hypothetical protein
MEHSAGEDPPPSVNPDASTDQAARERVTADVATRWVAAWTMGRTSSLFRLLAANATIESNLDPDGDFVEILTDFVDAVEEIAVFSQVVSAGRALLLYDCEVAGERFRLAEALEVDTDGLIREVRRVYDLAAVDRLLPGLIDVV